ncbi:hypothetical protein [Sphingobium mellinum]|uniref:hypothetical protein n=1 Tax=Sphingobium mellinum TaxID=1387166 RepID=UPI0030ED0536
MSGRPKWIYASSIVGAVLLALLAWNWSALRARAQVGAGFGARITCSCRYVEGRSLDSCRTDKDPGMVLVTLSDEPEVRAVRASVPLLATRRARYRPGWGCLLDPPQ